MSKFRWMKAFFSPFKRPKIKLYIGKTAIGTPYFLPRKWVKYTKKEVFEKAKEIYDKALEDSKTDEHFDRLVHHYTGMTHAIPKKIGFDFVGLGWKTKFDDYRHEWNPVWSFVFFKWQIALQFIPPYDMHYWESWLYYELDTDRFMTKAERIEHCLKFASQIWTSYDKETGEPIRTNYYTKILKKKYLKLIKDE